jgi:hypothetical protein
MSHQVDLGFPEIRSNIFQPLHFSAYVGTGEVDPQHRAKFEAPTSMGLWCFFNRNFSPK